MTPSIQFKAKKRILYLNSKELIRMKTITKRQNVSWKSFAT